MPGEVHSSLGLSTRRGSLRTRAPFRPPILSGIFRKRLKDFYDLIHSRIELRKSKRLLHKRQSGSIRPHRLVVLHAAPLGIHCDLGTVETFPSAFSSLKWFRNLVVDNVTFINPKTQAMTVYDTNGTAGLPGATPLNLLNQTVAIVGSQTEPLTAACAACNPTVDVVGGDQRVGIVAVPEHEPFAGRFVPRTVVSEHCSCLSSCLQHRCLLIVARIGPAVLAAGRTAGWAPFPAHNSPMASRKWLRKRSTYSWSGSSARALMKPRVSFPTRYRSRSLPSVAAS
jgi:hypothetical protein